MRAAKPKPTAALPPLVLPERFAFLAHRITPTVRELFEARIFGGKVLMQNRRPTVEATREEVKIALLIVHFTNPYEDLGKEEDALIRGMSLQTYDDRRRDNLIAHEL